MKRFALFLLLVLSIAAQAQDARHARAAELIEAMHGEQMMAKMIGPMQAQMRGMFNNSEMAKSMNAEQKKIFADYMQREQALSAQMTSWEKIKPIMVDAYAETFTEDELVGLTTFYRSPVGQAFLEKTPEMSMKMMGRMLTQMQQLQPQIEALSKEMAEKMLAAGKH